MYIYASDSSRDVHTITFTIRMLSVNVALIVFAGLFAFFVTLVSSINSVRMLQSVFASIDNLQPCEENIPQLISM